MQSCNFLFLLSTKSPLNIYYFYIEILAIICKQDIKLMYNKSKSFFTVILHFTNNQNKKRD